MDVCSQCLIKPIWSLYGNATAKLCLDCKIQNNKYRGIDRTREMVRMRDNQTCQECKKVWIEGNRKYDVHHLNGLCGKRSRKYDKVSEMDGLITLCHKCHYNRFDHSMKSYKQV